LVFRKIDWDHITLALLQYNSINNLTPSALE
jgi:hypothetical protein